MDKLTPNNLLFERLDNQHLKLLKSFKCWEKDLVDFLIDDAYINQQKGISVTHLCFLKETKELVGYVSVLTDAINLTGDLKEYFRAKENIQYKSLPGLKIGRLAVDERHMRKGIGTQMVYLSVFFSEKIYSEYAGCRFITVDAKRNADPNKDSLHFYKRMGFKILRERDKGSVPMYLDLWLKDKKQRLVEVI